MKQKIKMKTWLGAALLALTFGLGSSALAGDLDTSIPMTEGSWADVARYMNDINYRHSPSKVDFVYPQPKKAISEKTAVIVLDSVRDSLEDSMDSGRINLEPWIFDHVNLLCGLPCDGT